MIFSGIKKKFLWYGALSAYPIICKGVTAKIFIHGTVLAGYFFLDIPAAWNDSFKKDCLIERAMHSARNDSFLHEAELILNLGLQEITSEVLQTRTLLHEKAAVSLVRAFHAASQAIAPNKKVHYYTFGWLGSMSEKQRDQEALVLYHNLIELKKKLASEYPGEAIHIELYAHSHGGQLVAHLASIHKLFPTDQLHIDIAVLCATPLYKTRIQPMISSSLYSYIINMHSEGDTVQPIDIVSTVDHTCFRNFREIKIPIARTTEHGPTIIDARLTVCKNPKVFEHSNLFSFSPYRLPSYFVKRRDIRATLNLFDPLPVLVFYPIFVQGLQHLCTNPGYHQVSIDLRHIDAKKLLISHVVHFPTLEISQGSYRINLNSLSNTFKKIFSARARDKASHHIKYAIHHLQHVS